MGAANVTGAPDENGTSVLDGILPKDFGSLTKDEKSNVTFQTNNNGTSALNNSGNNGMLSNLLEGKQPHSNDNHINNKLLNGITNPNTAYLPNNITPENPTNIKKMNGGVDNTIVSNQIATSVANQQILKRPSSENDGATPPKKVLLDPQQLVNGIANGQVDMTDIDESNPILKTDVNLAQAAVTNQGVGVVQQQQKIVQVAQPGNQQQPPANPAQLQQQTQRILTTADGKQILVKSPAQGNVLTVQQQVANQGNQNAQGGKTIIILQPQTKVLNAQGQPQSTMLMTQPTTAAPATGNLQTQVIMQGGQQVGTVTPITYMNAQSLPPASVMAVAGGFVPQNGSTGAQVVTHSNAPYMNGSQAGSSAISNSPNMHTRHPSGSGGSVATGSNVIRQSPTPPIQNIQQPVQQRVQSPLPPAVAASIANVSLPNSTSSIAGNNTSSQLVPANSQLNSAANGISQQANHPSLPQTPHPPVAQPTTIQPQYVPVPQGVLPPPNPQRPFICEWAGCMKDFRTPKEVEKHAIIAHCAYIAGQGDMPCLWSRCDGMKRKRFSLMTHIQDRHCHPQVSNYN